MAKEVAILAVSIITLLVAGYAAYSVMGLNDTPLQVSAEKDYSAELKSIQYALDDVSKKLEALQSDVQELQVIKNEIDDKKSETQQVVQKQTQQPTQPTFDVTTNKNSYKAGESIIITAKGVSPQQTVKLDLVSSVNELIITQIVFSDSTGKLIYDMSLPSFLKTGVYKLIATYNNVVDETTIGITGTSQSTSTETQPDNTSDSIVSSQSLSFGLDKSSYTPGDIIWVTGKGTPNTSVVLKMTSPTAKVQMANTNALGDGTFSPVFVLPSDAEAGEWNIVATQNDKEATVKFKVITANSS